MLSRWKLQIINICIRYDVISIDPLLLFQQIILKMKTHEELIECFKFELSPIPLSLFDETSQMRKTRKSILYDIFPITPNTYTIMDENILDIIDGGFLLHRVVWPSIVKYIDIFEAYVTYMKRHYGINCIVVFDRYINTNHSIKSTEKHRQQNINKCADVYLNEIIDVLTLQEKIFIEWPKQNYINRDIDQ